MTDLADIVLHALGAAVMTLILCSLAFVWPGEFDVAWYILSAVSVSYFWIAREHVQAATKYGKVIRIRDWTMQKKLEAFVPAVVAAVTAGGWWVMS